MKVRLGILINVAAEVGSLPSPLVKMEFLGKQDPRGECDHEINVSRWFTIKFLAQC